MRRALISGALLAATLALPLCAACGDDSTTPATATPSPATTATAAVPGDVQVVITALLSSDRANWTPLLAYVQVPCTSQPGQIAPGGPTGCAAGEAEGTPVKVFPTVGCEFEYVRQGSESSLRPDLAAPGSTLYAAFKRQAAPFVPEKTAGAGGQLPQGSAVVVIESPDQAWVGGKAPFAVHVDNGRVVLIQWACDAGTTAKDFVKDVPSADFLVAPQP